MPISSRTQCVGALLSIALAYACGKNAGDDSTDEDGSGSLPSSPAAAGSSDADTCTPAGGQCLARGSTQACAHAGLSELYCSSDGDPAAATCCLDPFFAACDQGRTFPIAASNYDQSCERNSDCIGIGEGNGCDCGIACSNAAINVRDREKWLTDLQVTPSYRAGIVCNCPASFGVGCIDRKCVPLRPGLQ
jgi:hypothetical protein